MTFIFAAALTLFLNVFAARAHADDDAFAQGLLWRIERPGAAPSYLLGTIHLPDPRVSRPTPNTLRALGRCKTLFTEVEFEPQAIAAALSLPPGESLQARIGATDFDALSRVLKARGIPPQAIDRIKPFAVMALLVMPQSGSEKPLDLRIRDAGRERGLRLGGLETAAEQVATFDSISEADQAALLRELVQQHHLIPGMLDKMIRMYMNEDISGLWRFSAANVPEMPTNSALATRIRTAMLDDRNVRMVDRMRGSLDRGAAFVAVGAGHLGGPRGILRLLAARGYTLTPETL